MATVHRAERSRKLFVSLAAVLMLGTMASVSATPHTDLKSSTPADKARLATIPKSLRLTFTEAPELALTHVKLLAAGSKAVALGPLTVSEKDKATVTAAINGSLVAGIYTVQWETAGEDGHPADGTFTFAVTPEAIAASRPPPGQVPVPAPAVLPQVVDTARPPMDPSMIHHDTLSMPESATRFDAESGGFVIVRFVLYTALLIVIGAVAFRAVVLGLLGRRPDVDPIFLADAARRAAAIGWVAGWLLLAACLARLLAQSIALNGFDGMLDSSRLGILMGTKWGRGWLAQLVATVAALYGFSIAKRRTAAASTIRVGWIVVGIAAVVLAFTPAFASHAAASPRLRSLAMVFDGLHVTGAAGWVGSLVLVIAAGIPAALALREERRGSAVADLINAFSPTALVFAGLVASTGLFAAWLHVGGFAALWQAKYGNLLLAKLTVLSVATLTGAYNWLRVKPTLGTIEAAARIRRSATVELVVTVVVVLITAVLVATPPPMAPM